MSQALSKQEKNMPMTVIRPEMNLEKWPAIWTPAQSRTKPKLRGFERTNILEDGSIVLCSVTIDPSLQYGNLTTEDLKVWYGLLYLWEEAGKPEALIFSLNKLAKVLKRAWNDETGNSLKKSLKRLSRNTFSWVNSYYDNSTKKTLKVLNEFHILSELQIATVSERQKINNEQCICKFSELLYYNLLNSYTKPVYFDEVLKIKSGVAQLIYKYLELVMYDKIYYERKSENLFDDIGLDSEEYKKPSARKRILLIAIKELKEIPFPGGILEIGLELTKDKWDWKLTVKKTPVEANKTKKTSRLKQPRQEPVKESISLQEEIVNYFLERFGLRREASKAELGKAKEFIEIHQLNFELAKYIVDYAKCAAVETNYTPKNFSGIAQYVEQALAQCQAKQSKSRIKEEITKCCFCNDDGFIGVINNLGQRATMRCPHNAEILKTKAARENIKFDFWSINPPEFNY